MRTDNFVDARVVWTIPLRTIEIPKRQTKRVALPRFSGWRRTTPGQGTIALAALGRETGARC